MTEVDRIQIKQRIQVSYPGHKDDWYASSVQDVNGNEICISVPVKETRALILFKGEKVKVMFIAEMARYQFEAEVLGWKQDNIPLFILGIPSKFNRIQLREFVRVPISLPVSYASIPADDDEPVFTRTDSLDLSGGGIRLFSNTDLRKDTRLIINFAIPMNKGLEHFSLVGVVVRVWSDDITRLHQAAVRFARISSKQEDLISNYLFMVMSEQRHLRLD